MASPPAPSKLDEIASPEAQQAWITSPPSEVVSPSRRFPELGDDEYDDRLAYLLNAPEWHDIQNFLRYYIFDFIFQPFATEGIWWNASIREKGGFVRINIGRQEVLLIDFRSPSDGGEPLAFGAVWVDADGLERALQSDVRLPQAFKIDDGHGLKTVRQKRLQFSGASGDTIVDLFNSQWLLRAARSANLDLMRTGKLAFGWSQFHVRKLIDAVFADEPDEIKPIPGAPEMRADDAQIAEETEIQRLVWLRKNQAKFSNPVKRFWKGRCAVTDIEAESVLQACHIKPFSESSDIERLDEYNGLCLSAHIHSAFDAHLVGFAPNGEICLSDRLSHEDRQRMGLNGVTKIELSDQHRPYIADRYARFLAANPSAISSAKDLETSS